MTAMMKPPDCHSDSDDSDSFSPPQSKSTVHRKLTNSKANKYNTNLKAKLLYLKTKKTMQRFSPKESSISPPYPHITTPQLTDDHDCTFPSPNHNLHSIPPNNSSPHQPQLTAMSSPLYFHNPLSHVDNNTHNPSNISLILQFSQTSLKFPPCCNV